ncbi:DUF3618 domain-containing protein [Intrasporangium sp.]|uniref:DUF3618 domain-containing protein n=1 Tax=Intrasporangium sp. TaxID=1925024 RepID=UPI003221F330
MSQAAMSPSAIEKEIDAARGRLESTVNELAYRAQPRVIVQKQVADLKQRLAEVTHTPEGDLRVGRVAAAVAVGIALLALAVRRHRRG